MSLLEDVFLEDEAGEARELERVIEGDEYDDRPTYQSENDSNDNSEKEDEAEEDKRRVDPASTKTKRVVKNPRFILNPARLTGPRGIQVIPDHFKDFKFKGKGHEKEDLDLVLKKLEHWAYRLYPKFKFDDCLKKIETLGKKRPVMVHLQKIRSDQLVSEDTVVQRDSSDEEAPAAAPEQDEFDKLLQQQIDLARTTPAPGTGKKPPYTPKLDNRSPLTMPKAISSPSISDEQKERIIRNRKLAEERRLARLKNNSTTIDLTNNVVNEVPIVVENHVRTEDANESIDLTNSNSNITVLNEIPIIVENHVPIDIDDEPKVTKHNRSNVIDSSDDECEEISVNQSVTVDVHNIIHNDVEMNSDREDDIRDTNEINDIEIDISEEASENTSIKNNSANISQHLVNNEENTNDNNIVEEVNEEQNKEREQSDNVAGDENNVFDKMINEINDITENSNSTEAVRTENINNKFSNEDNDLDDVSVGVNIENSIAEDSNTQIVNRNESAEFNRIENDISKNCDENNDLDNVNDRINNEDSIAKASNEQNTNRIIINKSNDESDDFDNVNDGIDIENSTSNSNAQIDNDSIHNASAKVSETNTNLENKENIDNNVELDLMDVDFSEDF